MNAEIIAVGSEMLTPQRLDTNSLWLTGQLNILGVEVVAKAVVGDDRKLLAELVALALRRSEILLVTGGLGPTEDDVTRDAVALALGRTMTFRQDICDAIAERFARMGRTMAEINKRQAWVIDGFEPLPNSRGTAPGLWRVLPPGEFGAGRAVALLPGPPAELTPMFERDCLPRLRELVSPLEIRTRFYRVAGMPESDLDQLIAPAYTRYTNPVTTILAKPGDIEIHLRSRCRTADEADRLLSELGAQIEALLGDRIYTRDGDPLEAVIGRMLRESGSTLSVAESCTGGLLGQRITAVPGSSGYFLGGFLTYTDEMKTRLLGVDPGLLRAQTAVSEETAVAMAEGARAQTGSAYAVSITGIAGPDGGTEATPAGSVFVGLSGEGKAEARRFRFLGDRERVRTMAAQMALDVLRRRLMADLARG